MKNLLIFLGMIGLSACGAVKTAAVDASAASDELPAGIAEMQGKFYSSCIDLSGSGAMYARLYAVVDGYEESVLIYNFGTNAGCTGSPTTQDFDGNPTSTPQLMLTMVDSFEPADMPAGYRAYSFFNVGKEDTIRTTLAYIDGNTMYSPMASVDLNLLTNSGASWSDWITSDSNKLGEFGADHTAGLDFAKVDAQP